MGWTQRSKEIFAQEIEELRKVADRLGGEMDQVVDLIYGSSGKVVITGIGKTGIIGIDATGEGRLGPGHLHQLRVVPGADVVRHIGSVVHRLLNN